MREDQQAAEPPFTAYGRTLRRRAWWIIGTTVIVAAAALGYSLYQTKGYTSTATVQVEGSQASKTSGGVATQGQVQSDVEIVNSQLVRNLVRSHLSTPIPFGLTATVEGTNQDLFTISATAPTPADAAVIANTAFAQFQGFEKTSYVNSLNQLIGGLKAEAGSYLSQINANEAQLKTLGYGTVAKGKTTTNTPQIDFLLQADSNLNNQYQVVETSINDDTINSSASTGGLLQIGPALAPKVASSPKTTRNIELGVIVGLILGLMLAFVVDAFDDTIKSKEDIDRAYPKLPNLGVIPIVDSWKVATVPYLVTLKAPLSHATEAYRSLRTAVEFARMNRSVRSIIVTSSMDFEGKTSTVANLGITFAKAGQRTLIVSADLRRPRMSNFFGSSDDVGLASVALGIATFDEAVMSVADVPGLFYLGTGPLPAEAAEFLSSRKVEEIFRSLRERFDVILIDTPPAVLVTDAMIMSRYVDAVILVVAQGRTRRRSLGRVRELCAQVDAPVIGTILNGAATKGADSYGYGYRYGHHGYGYGYGYGQSRSEPQPTSRRAAKRQAKAGSLPPGLVAKQPASASQAGLDAESEQTGS